ncbi:transcriptional regulator [Asticcacaulis sp. EMRT-3]|uniref:beta strand repeat-containing protein n=1 Tax=Asticcacaulis sp. EMRT-3 TaxID=3040349 RepID=UPI0024AF6680|nr:transcriptional regulator [Asticcacaulis sp. EMRT-3]MDI7775012.1 transcriptional regulator [Asticcacaulis sp. EMRT-3]
MNIQNATVALSLFTSSSSSSTDETTLLTNYYNAKAGITGTSASGTSGSTTATATPTKTTSPTGSADAPSAPWNDSNAASEESNLVNQVMQGQSFINPNRITSNVINASPDYTKLFTLYQGLSALEGIATAAQAKNVSSNQLVAYQRRFTQGMTEAENYISSTNYDHVSLTAGTLTDNLQNTVGTATTNSTYIGQNIQTGSLSSAVNAFQGNVQFSMTVNRVGTPAPITVNFDLSEMGTTTRSMSNVVSYMNDKLKAAGLSTRMAVNTTPAVPVTTTLNGQTVTLSAGQASYGLKINGASYETVTLNAPDTADSVYVTQTTGDPTKVVTPSTTSSTSSTTTSTSSTTAADATPATDVTSQLLKFQTSDNATGAALDPTKSQVGDTYWVSGESGQTALPATVADVVNGTTQSTNTTTDALATATGTDGSVYVLANVNGTTDGQDIKGTQDVALTKYDSAGNVVYTRMLGASDTASGYALSVSADGKVAIAGSVTGALDINNPSTTLNKYGLPVDTGVAPSTAELSGSDPTQTDSFVTVLNNDGTEAWTQRRAATAADQATSVAFGADDSVYVGGKTQSTMQGATTGEQGGWDAYVQGFSATGQSLFTQQTGTPQSDSTAQVALDGNTLYVASLQNNDTVLTSYDISTGKAVETGQRSLGGIGGGNVSALAVQNGQVYLGGSTSNSNLVGATANVTHAYSGGYDAFALSVNTNLSDTSGDTIAYYGGAGNEQNAQVAFSNGNAYIAGQTTGAIAGTTQIGKQDGYLAEINVASGQVVSQVRNSGTDGVVTTNSIAVSSGGSSILDKLGLPQGTIQQTDSDLITANSSVRAGDKFYMVDPQTGVQQTITIDAGETMASLATKIQRASSYQLNVSVTKIIGKQQNQLTITPANSSSAMEFVAGPAGQDALAGLGLPAGLVSNAANQTMDPNSSNYTSSKKDMGLSFNSSLNLNSSQNIADAITSLKATMANIQKVYTYLENGDPQPAAKTTGNGAGTVPQYLTDQIANYQAALARLTGQG